jgi:hypothetical protein
MEEKMDRVRSLDMKLDRTPKGLVARLRHRGRERRGERLNPDLSYRRNTKQRRDTEHYKTYGRLYPIKTDGPQYHPHIRYPHGLLTPSKLETSAVGWKFMRPT